MSGYILLHRRIINHEVFSDEPYCERMAWVWLLSKASYEPHKTRYNFNMISVGRGEVPTSYRRLQVAWKWGVHRVRNFLQLLEQEGMITRNIETGFLIISICNYDKYQATPEKSETHPTTPSATHPTTNRININKINTPYSPPLPEWIPRDDWDEWVKQRKKKPTSRAIELAIKKLEQFRGDGYEPAAVLQNSIMNGWDGLFAPKNIPAKSKRYNVWKN